MEVKAKSIVITGGPGTGKTSIINKLQSQGYPCLLEISRQVTLEARKKGIEQLFLTEPLLFSEMLLDGRKKQHAEATESSDELIFLDRGIPDIVAYMDFIGSEYPQPFIDACNDHRYDLVFILPPWEAIYKSDNERYESFDEALRIHDNLLNTYKRYRYNVLEVPFGPVVDRCNFILNEIKY